MKPFQTPSEFRAAFDELVAGTQRCLRLYDHDLSAFDIEQLQRHSALRTFCLAGNGRRIEFLLDAIDHISRDCPRLMQLVRNFGHVIDIRQADPNMPRPDQAFALTDHHGVLIRPDKTAMTGTLHLDDAQTAIRLKQEFELIWQRSPASVTASTLGL